MSLRAITAQVLPPAQTPPGKSKSNSKSKIEGSISLNSWYLVSCGVVD